LLPAGFSVDAPEMVECSVCGPLVAGVSVFASACFLSDPPAAANVEFSVSAGAAFAVSTFLAGWDFSTRSVLLGLSAFSARSIRFLDYEPPSSDLLTRFLRERLSSTASYARDPE
jgi:hypothetical protein